MAKRRAFQRLAASDTESVPQAHCETASGQLRFDASPELAQYLAVSTQACPVFLGSQEFSLAISDVERNLFAALFGELIEQIFVENDE